jgi:CRP/FNR family transcriptional regulator, cyclic AMP receptor protein
MAADVTGILHRTDLLRSVPAEALETVAAASRLRTFRRGQVVFSTGDPGDSLVVVISGRVKVVVRSVDGGEPTLTIIQAGGVFGELSVADGSPRSADAETLDDCDLLFIPRDDPGHLRAGAVRGAVLDEFHRGHPPAAHRGGVDLVFLDLPRRLAKVLLSHPRGGDDMIRLKPNLSRVPSVDPEVDLRERFGSGVWLLAT